MDLQRTPGNVFVSVPPPEPIQQLNNAGAFYRDWATAAKDIAVETTPTIGEVFDAFLPKHIAKTRWARYIIPGPASRVFDNAVFVYHNPCDSFWSLYNLGKALFSDLGIRLLKSAGVWEARIPIEALTDRGFVDSGLAAVEKTLTGMEPTQSRRTVREIDIENAIKRTAKLARERTAYEDRIGVPEKRRTALARLAVLEGK